MNIYTKGCLIGWLKNNSAYVTSPKTVSQYLHYIKYMSEYE